MSLSLAYFTNRRQPMIHWMLDAMRYHGGDGINLIVVDFYHSERNQNDEVWKRVNRIGKHVPPHPNVWNGPSRLTKENWFAASTSRNTAILNCETSHLLMVDDLSVPTSGFFKHAREAAATNWVVCGSYRKVNRLKVSDGQIESFDDHPQGHDSRLRYRPKNIHKCSGSLLFGCNLVAPVEAFLKIGGWPSDLCDGLGGEDYCCGICLENAGYQIMFNPAMQTYESEELHHVEPAFKKDDYHFDNGRVVKGGNGFSDKSHSALSIARASKHFNNACFGVGGIREARNKTLAGEPVHFDMSPTHDWYTKQPLSEM